ncbi:MAG: hypothetical protein ACKOEP_02220, partial [Phycisphaerales bacterium]
MPSSIASPGAPASGADGPPRHDRGWWYWTSYAPGDEHPRWMRRRGGPSAPDAGAPGETMLDGNALARGHAYFRVSDVSV